MILVNYFHYFKIFIHKLKDNPMLILNKYYLDINSRYHYLRSSLGNVCSNPQNLDLMDLLNKNTKRESTKRTLSNKSNRNNTRVKKILTLTL